MTMMFLFVISGAVVAGLTIVLKKYSFESLKVSIDVVAVGTIIGISLFAFPMQIISGEIPEISSNFWAPFVITVLINIGIMWGLVVSIALEQASLAVAFQGVTPMFVILTSWILLREFPTTYGLIGIIIIVIGLFISSIKRSKDKRLKLSFSLGVKIALVTAILGSIALPLDKQAVIYSSPVLLTWSKFLLVGVSIYILSKVSGRWKRAKEEIRLYSGAFRRYWSPVKIAFLCMLGIGLILGLSELLMNTGFLYGITPYVGSLKRVAIVVTPIFGVIFGLKGERENFKTRIVGSAVITIGIIFLPF